MGKLRQRHRFILTSLILALLHEWTLGRNPKRDLDELNLTIQDVISTTLYLIRSRLVKPSVRNNGRIITTIYILNHPDSFREADILTEKGRQTLDTISFEDLVKRWLEWQDE